MRTGSFQVADESMTCLNQTAYQDWIEEWDEGPPLPSVPLVRLWHAGLSFPVRLSHNAGTEPTPTPEDLAPLKLAEGDERQVNLDIYREIGLALAPTAHADALGAMFESRAHAELSVLDDDGKTLSQGPLDLYSINNLPSLSPEHSAAVLLDDGWHRFTPLVPIDQTEVDEDLANTAAAISGIHIESPFMWDITPLADEKQCFEQHWLSWTPVNAEHVAHWLDKAGDGRSPPVGSLQGPPSSSPTISETWYPWYVLAQKVEVAIYDGRLDAALRSEVARIREAFETHENEWKIRMREQTAEQIARFREDLPTGEIAPNPDSQEPFA
jgi:hypothetical protein